MQATNGIRATLGFENTLPPGAEILLLLLEKEDEPVCGGVLCRHFTRGNKLFMGPYHEHMERYKNSGWIREVPIPDPEKPNVRYIRYTLTPEGKREILAMTMGAVA